MAVVSKGMVPQTAPTYGTYQWLQFKLGLFLAPDLGTTANYEGWDSYHLGLIDHVIQSGVREFYFPILAPGQKRPYAWSFLKKAATQAQEIGTVVYDLPADFGGWAGDFTHAPGGVAADTVRRLKVIHEGDLRASLSMEHTDAEPEYVCIRAKTAASTANQIFEFSVHPEPSTETIIHYRYTAVPILLSTTNLYPQGVDGHAETIAASCLAKAECLVRGTAGPMMQMYQQRLQASVLLDSSFAGDSDDDEIIQFAQSQQGG